MVTSLILPGHFTQLGILSTKTNTNKQVSSHAGSLRYLVHIAGDCPSESATVCKLAKETLFCHDESSFSSLLSCVSGNLWGRKFQPGHLAFWCCLEHSIRPRDSQDTCACNPVQLFVVVFRWCDIYDIFNCKGLMISLPSLCQSFIKTI